MSTPLSAPADFTDLNQPSTNLLAQKPAAGDGGAEAKVGARKGAGPAPKPVAREAADSPAPDAGLPSRRAAIADERPDRAARRSAEHSTAGLPAQSNEAATSTRTRGAERASTGPPKHLLPISPLPASAESKKVIQWP